MGGVSAIHKKQLGMADFFIILETLMVYFEM